ncbi:MAG: single-stranded DNA-binding protein [Mycoplasmataceae bacterium]|jgi:single-strand DNA-binding protein|nr:single-stranded DNA-binding protein [Mycoplasmataceae bacterium]
MNKVFVIGGIVADPTIKVMNSGSNFASFTIATNDNLSKDKTYFFPVVCFGDAANFVGKFVKKGNQVVVDGRLTRRSYVDKEGKNIFVVEIVAEKINFLSSGNSSKSADANPILNSAFNDLKSNKTANPASEDNDELSFLDEGKN